MSDSRAELERFVKAKRGPGRPRLWERRLAPAMDYPGRWVVVHAPNTPRDAKGAVRRLRTGMHPLPGSDRGEWDFSAVEATVLARYRPHTTAAEPDPVERDASRVPPPVFHSGSVGNARAVDELDRIAF